MKQFYFLVISILIIFPIFSQQMPIDFENSNHVFGGFSGATFSTRNDPDNSANKVGQFNNNGAAADQGFWIDLTRDIDVTNQKEITLSFYAFDPNQHTILLKLENGTNPDVEVSKTIASGNATNWQNITFNFSNAKQTSTGNTMNATGTYSKLVLFIDLGVTTAGTYLFDNISDGTTATDPNALDVIYTDLVWSDEFDGASLDTNKWFHQTIIPNGSRWFNNEEQVYTDSSTNSFVANGNLHIVAKKETKILNGETFEYTSARLNSKYAFTYGRVDVKAKLPAGNGTWPAIWTLGKNISETGAYWQTQGFGTTGWPACGEIDIMEHGLHATNEVSSALHTPSSSGATVNTSTKMLADVANNFHIYSMNWSPNQITFMIDDVAYYTYKPTNQNSSTWPFDLNQFLLLNVAMGGFAGDIDANFTQSSMIIDYVRVYQNNTASTDDFFSSKFKVYPNPTSDTFSIKTDEKIDKVEIYSTLGQLVLSNFSNYKKINSNHLKSGLYLVKIYSNQKSITKKIIIRK
ncbi:family 16 glycosylhydrolase [Polaribacter porphyrae]|uniref:Beta-glucanase n=1 Tax=Polaribacter porphyrae TaxID=1137780 RepID=A0A2S7WSN0_9FLAO|nr:family 16 glycosylhydrolase [Polaribacter porphyrae]PQJ80599.1 beta-glucanase [Polaribacter porphyrae]